MGFVTVRLAAPGVKLLQTPTLLSAAIVQSNLIRWRGGLPEKLGGWQQFFPFPLSGIGRELWAWADLNLINHVAVAGTAGVQIMTGNANHDVTPLFRISNPTPSFSTTAGSSLVDIKDPGSNVTLYESITLETAISIGGGLLQTGNYRIVSVQSPDEYTIDAGHTFPNTEANAGVTAVFNVTAGGYIVTITLPNHGFTVGSTIPVYLPVTVPGPLPPAPGSVTLQGFYTVQTVPDVNTLTIYAPSQAGLTGSAQAGNLAGLAQIRYWVIITPPPAGGGWGVGGWGLGAWGQSTPPPPIVGNPLLADDWCLENWGSQLIINPEDGPLFYSDPSSGLGGSQQIVAAPRKNHGMFLAMPEQQIVSYGASTFGIQDPLLVAWCDNANYNVWTADVSNQAGTYRLTRGSKIVGGLQGPQQALLWTDVGLWLMAYIGYPDVYGFNEISRGCGLIAKKAAGVVGQQVFWMSRDGFWLYAGAGAQRLPCDVWDAVIKNLNTNFLSHIRCACNTGYDEVAWHYPSAASTGENDSYVKFNVVTGEWDYGSLTITEWIDSNVYGHPMSCMIGADGASTLIMQHEMTMDMNGAPMPYSFRTGYFQLSEGEDFVFVDYCIPDFKWKRFNKPPATSAAINMTFFVNDFPDDDTQPPIAIGPVTVTNESDAIDIRCRGRYFSVQVAGSDLGSFMRLGGVKFRFAPDGRNG